MDCQWNKPGEKATVCRLILSFPRSLDRMGRAAGSDQLSYRVYLGSIRGSVYESVPKSFWTDRLV